MRFKNRKEQWDFIYSSRSLDEIEWEIGTYDLNLQNYLNSLPTLPKSALEIGCGTGNDAVFMSSLGIDTTAIDIAEIAINYAKEKNSENNTSVNLLTIDVLDYTADTPYEFIFDRGWFHMYIPNSDAFVEIIHKSLVTGGTWLSLLPQFPRCVSPTETKEIDADEVKTKIEKYLKVISITDITLNNKTHTQPALMLLAQRVD